MVLRHRLFHAKLPKVFQSLASIALASKGKKKKDEKEKPTLDIKARDQRIIELERLMHEAAERLDFETAIKLREEWMKLKASK